MGLASWDLGEIAAAEMQMSEALELLHRAKELLEAGNMPEWDDKSWREVNLRIEELQR